MSAKGCWGRCWTRRKERAPSPLRFPTPAREPDQCPAKPRVTAARRSTPSDDVGWRDAPAVDRLVQALANGDDRVLERRGRARSSREGEAEDICVVVGPAGGRDPSLVPELDAARQEGVHAAV